MLKSMIAVFPGSKVYQYTEIHPGVCLFVLLQIVPTTTSPPKVIWEEGRVVMTENGPVRIISVSDDIFAKRNYYQIVTHVSNTFR